MKTLLVKTQELKTSAKRKTYQFKQETLLSLIIVHMAALLFLGKHKVHKDQQMLSPLVSKNWPLLVKRRKSPYLEEHQHLTKSLKPLIKLMEM